MYNSEGKNDSITQGIKISCQHKRNLYAFTTNNSDSKPEVHYMKYCQIVRKVVKEAKHQHKTRLIARTINKIITWNINQERGGKSTFGGIGSHLTCDW
jgi:ribosomal protein L33